jgi:hydrogenase/urease accessory protein HupE
VIRALGAALLALALAGPAAGHEVRPAYLELNQAPDGAYQVLFKVPLRGALRLGLRVRLPETCRTLATPERRDMGGASLERWQTHCEGGLAGRSLAVEGLATTLTDVLVRIQAADGGVQLARLTPAAPSLRVEAAPGRGQVATTYFRLGVEHILLGIDHLLFVAALLLLVRGWRRLVATVTAFTVAHSLTLALATLGWLRVPGPPVEAAIALSIVFVAAEILHAGRGRPGAAARWPWLVAFAFGLLHGLGFAGALAEIGLPQASIPLALLFFNLGVEAGQLLFVAALLVAWQAARALGAQRAAGWATPTAAYAIGSLAACWTLERVLGFVP